MHYHSHSTALHIISVGRSLWRPPGALARPRVPCVERSGVPRGSGRPKGSLLVLWVVRSGVPRGSGPPAAHDCTFMAKLPRQLPVPRPGQCLYFIVSSVLLCVWLKPIPFGLRYCSLTLCRVVSFPSLRSYQVLAMGSRGKHAGYLPRVDYHAPFSLTTFRGRSLVIIVAYTNAGEVTSKAFYICVSGSFFIAGGCSSTRETGSWLCSWAAG